MSCCHHAHSLGENLRNIAPLLYSNLDVEVSMIYLVGVTSVLMVSFSKLGKHQVLDATVSSIPCPKCFACTWMQHKFKLSEGI